MNKIHLLRLGVSLILLSLAACGPPAEVASCCSDANAAVLSTAPVDFSGVGYGKPTVVNGHPYYVGDQGQLLRGPERLTTVCSQENPLPVDLGTSGNFVILSKSGISDVPTSAITGNIAVSPAAATYLTGFGLISDASNVFSTASQVTGMCYAADYEPPTPSNLTTAVSDMETAFVDAAGRAACITELGAGDVSGMTLTRGVYKWGTGLLMSTDVTLSGSATDVFIFEIAQDLTLANGVIIHLQGGAVPANIFWQVSGAVYIGTTAHFEGIVLTQTAVTMGTGASINGRLLAQTAVNLDSNAVTQPVVN